MKVSFYTLGCKVNQYETECIAEIFKKNGYETVSGEGAFDIFVLNSCTVTAESDRKARQILRRYKNRQPNSICVLLGCMPQAFPEKAAELAEADIVLGNTNPADVLLYAEKFIETKQRIVDIKKHEKNEKYNTPAITEFSEHTRAFMKIQDGCERYCTYCIIPFARGFIRSRSIRDIKAEALCLSKSGYKEVVLVGINLTSFGKDTGSDIAAAVDAVSSVGGIERIRFGSIEPDLISDELLYKLSKNEKFCPQFHLSLQSGSDATLKRMNRHYDSAFYYDLVSRIRNLFDNPAITTDIMVGFAGETEAEFAESLTFAERVGFAKTHIFAYSKRAGTVAAGLPDQITNAEKERRSHLMAAVALESEQKFLLSQVGRKASVLFESGHNGVYSGYTENYTPVKVKSDKNICGKILSVELLSAENGYMSAILEE